MVFDYVAAARWLTSGFGLKELRKKCHGCTVRLLDAPRLDAC